MARLQVLSELAIRAQPAAAGSVYGFTQTLMREVASDSLVLSRRQALQAAAAPALAALCAAPRCQLLA